MNKKLITLMTIFILLFSLAGCSGQPTGNEAQQGQTQEEGQSAKTSLTYNLGPQPRTIDPATCDEVYGFTVINNVFEGLARYDKNGNPEPGMAESWETSDDGLTWTFHLRDAKWSDGKPVTAKDFEYSWKRALDPNTAGPYAYQLYYVKNGKAYNEGKADASEVGVKAIDDKTLKVTLESPALYFLTIVSLPISYPVREDIIKEHPEDWTNNPETYIGNGPFKMTEWVNNDSFRFVKNENYWDAQNVKLENLTFTLMTDENTALSAFKSGEVDYIDTVPPLEIPGLKEDGLLNTVLTMNTTMVEFNTTKKPLDDPKVRKALSLAIDRKTIVENITQGGEKPAGGLVAYGFQDAEPGKDFREVGGDYYPVDKADVETAKKLLAEAGYPDGKGFPKLTYIFNDRSTNKQIAQALQQMWKQNLGIDVELKTEEWQVFIQDVISGNYEMTRMGWQAEFMDPIAMLELFTTGSPNNDPRWSNKEYDELIETAKTSTGQKTRMEALHKAEDIIMEEMPIAPIFYSVKQNVVKPGLKDYIVLPNNGVVLFRNAYWAE
ncbi:MAG: peptide ABC transporter substrate-binding protein [Thermoanaerobacteraceae bacterium]|nr:peptide ABC transporter substrate-binding protein [Thermoanaerobacteraceae bacterium]